MYKQLLIGMLVGVLVVGFSASSAFAFRCTKLITVGRRLAAKASGEKKAQALKLLEEAEALHKGAGKNLKGHGGSMAKATDALDLLTK